LEDLGILSTIGFSHQAREKHAHVLLFSCVEIEAWLVIERGTENLIEGVRVVRGLEEILVEERFLETDCALDCF
jgi:hypothetical protein